jgi:hypothetical protein
MARHELLNGLVQIFRRGEGRNWHCSASINGRQYRATSPTALVVAGRITSPDCSRFGKIEQKCLLGPSGLFCELSYCQSVFRCRGSLSPSLQR